MLTLNKSQESVRLSLIFKWVFCIAISSFVVLPKVSSVALIVCLLLALYGMCQGNMAFDGYDAFVVVALLAYPLLAVVSLALHGAVDSRNLDTLSRFLLVIPLYIYWRKHPPSIEDLIIPCAISGGLIGGLALYELNVKGMERPDAGLNAITFGQLAVLLLFFSVVLLYRHGGRFRLARVLLSFIGVIGALIAAVLSGSRGPLLALPFLGVLLLYLMPYYRKRVVYAFILFVLLLLLAYFAFDLDVLRVGDAVADLAAISMGNADNSIGVRTQVWHAAFQLFEQNPWFGVGHGQFSTVVGQHQQELGVSQFAVGYHAHNDYLQLLAEMGVLGLTSVLLLFVGTVFLVFKYTVARMPRACVLAVSICWLIFAMTQVQLGHQRVVAFELLVLVFCLALAKSPRRGAK